MPGAPIGLYGGTFDPVHLGHLGIAEAARDELTLQSIVFIPARDPPLRAGAVASGADRLAMLELALRNRPQMRVDDQELRRGGPSYTFDTLHSWRASVGDKQPLAFLIGADAFARVERWHRWTELFDLAHFIVFERGAAPDTAGTNAHDSLDDADASSERIALRALLAARGVTNGAALRGRPGGSISRMAGPRSPASASAVRQRCAIGKTAADLLPAEVWAYITKRRLYGWRGANH